MMIVRIACLLFAGLLTASVCCVDSLNSDEDAARVFLADAYKKLFNCADEENLYNFNRYTTAVDSEESDDEQNNATISAILKYSKLRVEIFKGMKHFDESKFTDPEFKRVFGTMKKSAGYYILGEDKLIKIENSMQMLDDLESDRDISSYHNETVQLAFFPDVQKIFEKSNDPDELKYYWKEWRDKNGVWATSYFVKLVKLLEEAARLNGITPLEFWLEDYNYTEMQKIMKQIKPFYLQLHGFVRNQLQKKYGDALVRTRKPIPHHLFEQVLAQTWTAGSIIDDKYPHKDLPPYDKILEENNYDTDKMFKMADQFYRSMGFSSISDDYWNDHFKMDKNEDEGDCKPSIYADTPNVYMVYCQKMDFRKFLQAHGYMAEAYSSREGVDLPPYYLYNYDLELPAGEAVILSASTPKHLSAIGLTTQFNFTEDVKMNRLLRMGIHTLLNVPVYFVHVKVMADLFAGTVDITDLNKHYWKLMDKHVGVAPPSNRGEDAYDFPFKFYRSLSGDGFEQYSKFRTEVLAYQFYERLCEISGQFSKSIDSEPINNCDFYGSKKAGDVLKKMFQLGSSKPLNEVLATILPDNPTVDAESLLRYYTPVHTWLTERNREENVHIGWMRSRKRIQKVTNYDSDEEEDESP